MEPIESDSSKVKGKKSENEQDLGDAEGRDEVGDCSFEAEAAIPLAEAVGEGSDCDENDEEASEIGDSKETVDEPESGTCGISAVAPVE
ncbi:hypothetical protein U1Q18_017879, partial [Sarracenia purpurea var. burkii]